MSDLQIKWRRRAIALFRFLRDLTELRTRPVRDIDEYTKDGHVLWLDAVPAEAECRVPPRDEAPRVGDGSSDKEGEVDGGEPPRHDAWLVVDRVTRVPPPRPSAALEPWIRADTITDSDRDAPEHFASIPGDGADVMRQFADEPTVRRQWEAFLTRWFDWASEDRRLAVIADVYAQLFSVWQRLARLGDRAQLVVGAGLLGVAPENGPPARRHLLTVEAEILFDDGTGRISVQPAADAEVEFEQDMLDPSDRPQPDTVRELARAADELGGDIWNRPAVEDLLRRWIHHAGPSGTFDATDEPFDRVEADARIATAPALILRERTERSLLRTFDDILAQLESGGEVPDGIARYLDTVTDAEIAEAPIAPPEIEYLPLESNAEQRRILGALDRQQGVLVQGPPGTGKSHTIANLCCHLLATGQRVLITSHTAKALRVLEDKLPPGIRELNVGLLGHDRDALESVERSVQSITDRQQSFDAAESRQTIERLEGELHEARRAEAEAASELRDARREDAVQHEVGIGTHAGSLQQIAERLHAESATLGWIRDDLGEDTEFPLTDDELADFAASCERIAAFPEEDRSFALPSPEAVPTVDELAAWMSRDEELQRELRNRQLDTPTHVALMNAPIEAREAFAEDVIALSDTATSLRRHVFGWATEAARHILADQDRIWRRRLELTRRNLEELREKCSRADASSVQGTDGHDLRGLREDCLLLRDHFRGGGGFGALGFLGIRPRVIKQTRHIWRDITIDGRPCRHEAAVETLIAWIDAHLQDHEIAQAWDGVDHDPPATLGLRAEHYADLCEPLEDALRMHERVVRLREVLAGIEGIDEPAWHVDDELQAMTVAARSVQTTLAVERHHVAMAGWKRAFSTAADAEQPHPLATAALTALESPDAGTWAPVADALQQVFARREEIAARDATIARLGRLAPRLGQELRIVAHREEWQPRLRALRAAWDWSRCSSWVRTRLDPEREPRLRRALDEARATERALVADLTRHEAWHHCLARLDERVRQHLVAWTKAVRRIGKGTGKHAHKHRRAAREHMEECREAIPAWIMPIWRIAETIRPGRDAFDVVIVDEASQSGPEALFLLYLAKKIVVVGDDKQISPDWVGITRDDVDHLRQRHLKELPHADAFSLEHSLFDLADIRYGGRIRLKEHFRCMPEIIGFSNRLCYQSEPLIPLKQFGAGRLQPVIQTVRVTDGYRKGSGQKVANPAEAEAVVEAIARCHEDPDYDDRSFGVVSLQGAWQARLVEALLLERLGPEAIAERRLVCGDAYAFQGDERDVMFLSMVAAVSEDTRIGTLADQRSARRFNVAVSRAREQMWLFHSVAPDDLGASCIRRELLEYCLDPSFEAGDIPPLDVPALRGRADGRRQEAPPAPFDSWFEVDVALGLADRGFIVYPQFEVAGYHIDLVVEGDARRVAVECDGDRWHGPERFDADQARQRQLERCGWTFARLRGSRFYLEPERSLDELAEQLRG